jgi:hypothetical protein
MTLAGCRGVIQRLRRERLAMNALCGPSIPEPSGPMVGMDAVGARGYFRGKHGLLEPLYSMDIQKFR